MNLILCLIILLWLLATSGRLVEMPFWFATASFGLRLQFYLMQECSSDHPTSERHHPSIQQLDGFALQLVKCERRPRWFALSFISLSLSLSSFHFKFHNSSGTERTPHRSIHRLDESNRLVRQNDYLVLCQPLISILLKFQIFWG